MADLTDSQREVIERAKTLDAERVEIYMQAMKERVADLLPQSFSDFDAKMKDPVKVTLNLGLTATDAVSMTERECRDLISFFGEMADLERSRRSHEDEDE